MDAEESVGLVEGALAGEWRAQERLVAVLTPVIKARVARTLLSRPWALAGRDIHQEAGDLTQEAFLSLFENDGRVLRSWDAELGLSLENFVGLVAVCDTLSFLRSGRRNPWREELATDDQLDGRIDEPDPEKLAAVREELRLLRDGLHDSLSPLGWRLFLLLFVQELSVQEVMAATGLSDDAVYAWRSRLRRLAREVKRELSKTGSSRRRPGEDDEDDEDHEE
jgi:RNA polymerase sigma factor (sigma-70 family)